ncbi:MAG: HlyD family efflux transporter periplasmic adaptor subunit [Bacteroidetes bacterium]|nr:HlyD family efflux transporter periplasmic adaptor subunit [Bacteroidota bacterium]
MNIPVNDFIGKPPGWITRTGILVVMGFLALTVASGFLIRYPCTIRCQVTITSTDPPVGIHTMATGRIRFIYGEEERQVSKGEIIAFIENPADFNQVCKLDSFLLAHTLAPTNIQTADVDAFRSSVFHGLGEVQQPYSDFIQAVEDYLLSASLDKNKRVMGHLSRQRENLMTYQRTAASGLSLMEQDLSLAKKEYERYAGLHDSGVISESELEKRRSEQVKMSLKLEEARADYQDAGMRLEEINGMILREQSVISEENTSVMGKLVGNYRSLCSAIRTWRERYVLISPVEGVLSRTSFSPQGGRITQGEQIFTVTPGKKDQLIARGMIPLYGSGKVKQGQRARILIDDFPARDYGYLTGKVEYVSLVPAGDHYLAGLSLPDGLKTSYGYQLPARPEMKGTAEIITHDQTLAEVIIQPIRLFLHRHLKDGDEGH